MSEYRVNLDVYNGPMDLLLYLIRRDEVDIHDIPISRITEQYVQYVEMLQQIDPDVAGEFLVMAATLLEIKTRMLLPAPSQEDVQAGLTIDPRTELVRQLLQYKAFKDAAAMLSDHAAEQSGRFARRPPAPEGEQTGTDLEDVQVWDLVEAFSKILESIGHRPTHHQVIYDDTPLELHQEDLLDRLRSEGPLRFSEVFVGRSRGEMVGLFLAMLELVRLKKIVATQEADFGEIHVYLNPHPPTASVHPEFTPEESAPPAEAVAAGGPAPAAADRPGPLEPSAAEAGAPDTVEEERTASAAGRYVSDAAANGMEREDEGRTEDQGTGV